MPPVSEPQPGAGSISSSAVPVGTNPLTTALNDNTSAEKALTAAIKALTGGGGGSFKLPSAGQSGQSSDDEYQTWASSTPAQRRASQGGPPAVRGWNPGTVGGQSIMGSQGSGAGNRTLPPSSMMQSPAQQAPRPRVMPGGGYGGGSAASSQFPMSSMAQRPQNGGSTSISLPPGVYGAGNPPPGGFGQGSPLGGAGGAGGGAAAGGLGAGGGIGNFVSQNKMAIGIGAAAGAASAAGTALGNFSNKMLNTDYDSFGNLYVLKNGGYSGMSYGTASSQGINQLRPGRFTATSPADLIAGGSQIQANSNNQTFGANFSNATSSAYINPGMGLGQAATNQQQEGTNQANVMAQMMFGKGTLTQGGGQVSEVSLANTILNSTRGGAGMTGMTPDKMAAMLSQSGTLRANINTYASNAGLGASAVDSLSNILTAQEAYQNKYGNTTDFESTVNAAAGGDKSAQSKLQGTGIGESVQQSIQNRQGSQIGQDMNSQATYIDTLKETNTLLQGLNDKLTSFLKGSGLSGVLGGLAGVNSGTGGGVSGALKYGATGAVLGSFIGPEGTVVGGALGAAYGFISGGAGGTASGGSKGTQNAAPSPGTGAANSAVTFAEAQVGKPYVMGQAGPNAYDCSGLMQAAFKQAGVSIPRVSSDQSLFGASIPLNQIAPGDLIFPQGYDGLNGAPAGLPGHVMMALSGGPNVSVVEAANPQVGIINSAINIGKIESVRRMTNGAGTLSPNMNTTSTGASKTNTSSPAGTAQDTGGTSATASASGMNEIDVLGSILGRSAFQTNAGLPSSPQTSLNGTSSSVAAFAKGSYAIDGDQLANLHDGEMVLDARMSRSVRAALMADTPSHTAAGSSGGGINFASGAISVTVNGSMTSAAATSAGKQVASTIAADNRIQQIGAGL
jgi:cell wall-associated NlpC family hydrolase